jgi:hypothetical protein
MKRNKIMPKKILSSLLIASTCLNMFPVYAIQHRKHSLRGHLSQSEEKQGQNVQTKKSNVEDKQVNNWIQQRSRNCSGPLAPKVVAATLTLLLFLIPSSKAQEDTTTAEGSKCHTDDYHPEFLKDLFYSNQRTISYITYLPKMTENIIQEMYVEYGASNLHSGKNEGKIKNLRGSFLAESHSLFSPEPIQQCMLYYSKYKNSDIFLLAEKDELKTIENRASKKIDLEVFNYFKSKPSERLFTSAQGKFTYITLNPTITLDDKSEIFEAFLGKKDLSFIHFKVATSDSTKIYHIGMYANNETTFAKKNQESFIDVQTLSGYRLNELTSRTTQFWTDLFEGPIDGPVFPNIEGSSLSTPNMIAIGLGAVGAVAGFVSLGCWVKHKYFSGAGGSTSDRRTVTFRPSNPRRETNFPYSTHVQVGSVAKDVIDDFDSGDSSDHPDGHIY